MGGHEVARLARPDGPEEAFRLAAEVLQARLAGKAHVGLLS
jgi:hypothetical protein